MRCGMILVVIRVSCEKSGGSNSLCELRLDGVRFLLLCCLCFVVCALLLRHG